MNTNTQKNWFIRHWIVSTILVLIVLLIAIPSSNNKGTTEVTAGNNKQAKQYVEIAKFNGKGQKRSEPFTITGSRFKVAYDCSGDTATTYCGAFAYKVGSKMPIGVMNATQAVKDETVIYESGEYYIEANTMGAFSMTIYDYK